MSLKSFLLVLTAAGLLLGFTGTAQAIVLGDFNPGTHILNEEWEVADLKGRTVVVNFWDLT